MFSVSSKIIVIYDGECKFCQASIDWVAQQLVIEPQAYQITETTVFGLSEAQCAEQVFVIKGNETYAGAFAIRFLLMQRGNRFLAALVKLSGKLGQFGYKWVALNRNSSLVKLLTKILDRSNQKYYGR